MEFAKRTSWLRGSFLSGCGQGEGEVSGLPWLVCCLQASVWHGLWLVVETRDPKMFQNRTSGKDENLHVGHQEQRWGGGQGVQR